MTFLFGSGLSKAAEEEVRTTLLTDFDLAAASNISIVPATVQLITLSGSLPKDTSEAYVFRQYIFTQLVSR